MECLRETKMIKTFRGKINNGDQDTIVLHTNDGSIGYRIVKFQVMDPNPGTIDTELVVKIYKISQTAVSATIDFSDNTLLGACFHLGGNSSSETHSDVVIFDSEIFNQDIYVTNQDAGANTEPANYYIELEQVRLDLNENTVATLKDIRNLDVAI